MSRKGDIEEVKGTQQSYEESEVVERPKVKADYRERGLDACHFCGLQFNVGERIPRIIIGCGHTFCTSCLSYFLRNHRIRCPLCRKLLKGVDSVDKLPLNFNILYEVVTRDPLLSRVNFEKCLQADPDMYQDDEAYERDFAPYMCQKHEQRIKHFYCSEHPSIFCRECIKDLHNLEACFVVDLYEIEKMRKLQEQNNEMNRRQLSRRQDGASDSYVQHSKLPPQEPNPLLMESSSAATQERRPRHEAAARNPTAAANAAYVNAYQPHKPQQYPGQSTAMPAGSGGTNAAAIVEFDATQFDGQGMSSQQLMKQQMLSGANQQFAQAHFGYGQAMAQQQREQADEASFSDDDDEGEDGDTAENGEEEEDNSDYEEGELNSAQKQKLKRDLLMMGYGQNGEFEDEDDEEEVAQAFIAGAHKHAEAQKMLQMCQQDEQSLALQKAQFQEAMRIQMAMKQMPIDDGDLTAAQVGLRMKQQQQPGASGTDIIPNGAPMETLIPIEVVDPLHQQHPATFELTPPPVFTPQYENDEEEDDEDGDEDEEAEQQLTEKEKFELEKKLLKQQMKEQLLGGRSAKPAPSTAAASEPAPAEEEVKVAAHPQTLIEESSGANTDAAAAAMESKSTVGQIQVSDSATLKVEGGDANRDVLAESLQAPPVQEESRIDTPRDLALEKQSLTDKNQSNIGKVNQKENTAPENSAAASQTQ